MENKNHGVLLGNRETDWGFAGAASQIVYKEELPSGDWTLYLPEGSSQWFTNGFDALDCVSESATNIISALYHFKTGVKKKFSPRFTAVMSGTTKQGNYLWKVGDSIRKDGVVEISFWSPIDNPTWDTYYIPPTIEIINKAKEFLKDWEVQYEVIDFTRESLLKHIKQSPLQVVIPGHAVMNFLTTDQIYKYFDSYNPWIKERSEGFVFAQKYILNKKTMYTLYKDPLAIKEIYAVLGNTKHHIGTYPTLENGKRLGKWEFSTVNDIPFADTTAFANMVQGDEMVYLPEQIVFTPHD